MATTTNRRRGMSRRGGNDQTDLEDVTKQARGIVDDAIDYLRDYAREKPESAALWCLGIGFVLGWKLKP